MTPTWKLGKVSLTLKRHKLDRHKRIDNIFEIKMNKISLRGRER